MKISYPNKAITGLLIIFSLQVFWVHGESQECNDLKEPMEDSYNKLTDISNSPQNESCAKYLEPENDERKSECNEVRKIYLQSLKNWTNAKCDQDGDYSSFTTRYGSPFTEANVVENTDDR
jgi:hypothetical protein